jgi:hypothetical protein
MNRFFLGMAAKALLRAHYRHEVLPYAARNEVSMEDLRHAAHLSLDRLLDDVLPTPTGADRGAGG